MRSFRLALAQINSTVGDLHGNVRKILDYIDNARDLTADLVAFPETAITGYPAEDLMHKPAFLRDNMAALQQVVQASRGITVVVGFVDTDGDIFNAAAIANDGKLAGVYHKIHLPTYGVFDEDRYFRPGESCPVYIVSGTSVAVNICEDAWYPLEPTLVQRQAGAEILVNINASPYHSGKQLDRERMMATRASDNKIYAGYLNAVGGQDELVFDGASMVFDPEGKIIARGANFEEDLLISDLDMDALLSSRLKYPRIRNHTTQGRGEVVLVSEYQQKDRPALKPRAAPSELCREEEVYQALVTGCRDYVGKNGFSRVLIGLSGGIDSALTACIATDALGKNNVLGITMPSRYSSEGSIDDSVALSENLGIEIWTIPIEPAHTAFQQMLKDPFVGTIEGVAEENIQARIRGNILMAISNKFGWLVLTTGNKSEMAMGYATLYGDMAGGFAVLKDVPKTMVYELCNWRNENKRPTVAIPQDIILKPPSAELRPNQKDADTLPAYDVLDQILKAYVEEDLDYGEIISLGFDPSLVQRTIATVDRNEYKRRQSPPGIKITPKAFGRDRRLPIVNHYRQF
ncbi:NAD+ synthase [SAR202 cluster bacterium AD-804-J14_MRT_500m]|nr:NAD+ synthase [SAR202 cluster bacterium AD-804-J14_MRT_500m]